MEKKRLATVTEACLAIALVTDSPDPPAHFLIPRGARFWVLKDLGDVYHAEPVEGGCEVMVEKSKVQLEAPLELERFRRHPPPAN